MRKRWLLAAGGAVLLALFLAISGYFSNMFGSSGPECGELPARAQAERAVEDRAELVRRLTAAVPGAEVSVTTPCPDPGVGLVVIRVADPAQQARAEELLAEAEGFGVPTVVQQK